MSMIPAQQRFSEYIKNALDSFFNKKTGPEEKVQDPFSSKELTNDSISSKINFVYDQTN